MYHAFVRRKVENVFNSLSKGDYETALEGMAPHFEHIFAGRHPLGGVRHSPQALRLWFERLFRINRGLHFTVKHIAVSGGPWDTTVTAEWHDHAKLINGDDYDNDGVHVIRLKWGKVVSLHAYLDTEIFANACRKVASDGFPEAAASPIQD